MPHGHKTTCLRTSKLGNSNSTHFVQALAKSCDGELHLTGGGRQNPNSKIVWQNGLFLNALRTIDLRVPASENWCRTIHLWILKSKKWDVETLVCFQKSKVCQCLFFETDVDPIWKTRNQMKALPMSCFGFLNPEVECSISFFSDTGNLGSIVCEPR